MVPKGTAHCPEIPPHGKGAPPRGSPKFGTDSATSPARTGSLPHSLLQCLSVIDVWRTGNKSPRAFDALAPAKIPRHNYLRSTKKRRTRWSRSSWRACSRPPARTPKPPSGTAPQRHVFAAPIGKPKRNRLRRDSVENLLAIRNSIFRSLLLHRFLKPTRRLRIAL